MVYVDKLQIYIKEQIDPLARKYGAQWCHLFSDNEQELHEFASKLGLRRDWFQNKKSFPHYDIVKSKRQQAIVLGAQEIDLRDYIKSKLKSN
jgi:hypothetical protein